MNVRPVRARGHAQQSLRREHGPGFVGVEAVDHLAHVRERVDTFEIEAAEAVHVPQDGGKAGARVADVVVGQRQARQRRDFAHFRIAELAGAVGVHARSVPHQECGMPELPEVESVRRAIDAGLPGVRIEGARLHRAGVAEAFDAGGTAREPTPTELLAGARIARTARRGKQLAIIADDGRSLCVHLGMSGVLSFEPAGEALRPHTHAEWMLPASRRLVFIDPRRFGGLWCFPTFEALEAARWRLLGPDALDARAEHLAAAGSRRSIKALLLDQAVLAGVGNIYADESLFRARVRPSRRAGSLHPDEREALAGAVREVLHAAIDSGGSTLRDYRRPDGSPGAAQERHAVYGRAAEACLVCRGTLRSGVIAQRTTVWCPACQPARPTRLAKPPAPPAYPHGAPAPGRAGLSVGLSPLSEERKTQSS